MNHPVSLQELSKTFSYDQYKNMVVGLAMDAKTSGEQTKEHIDATLINAQRMKRIDKQCEINEELKESVAGLKGKYLWIVIAETWCGDGAQCIPVIAKIAELNKNIEIKIILRDENLEFMDAFLTNGSRGIPKLICLDKSNNNVLGSWGPRPKAIQNMVVEFKKNNPGVSHEEFVKNVHLWYARDKTAALQNEFLDLIKQGVLGN